MKVAKANLVARQLDFALVGSESTTTAAPAKVVSSKTRATANARNANSDEEGGVMPPPDRKKEVKGKNKKYRCYLFRRKKFSEYKFSENLHIL